MILYNENNRIIEVVSQEYDASNNFKFEKYYDRARYLSEVLPVFASFQSKYVNDVKDSSEYFDSKVYKTRKKIENGDYPAFHNFIDKNSLNVRVYYGKKGRLKSLTEKRYTDHCIDVLFVYSLFKRYYPLIANYTLRNDDPQIDNKKYTLKLFSIILRNGAHALKKDPYNKQLLKELSKVAIFLETEFCAETYYFEYNNEISDVKYVPVLSELEEEKFKKILYFIENNKHDENVK